VNIGGTETLSILELAQAVQEHLGIPLPLRATFIPYDQFPGNYQDVRHRVPDTTKARELLGFEATTSLAEGLAETVAWHRAQRVPVQTVAGR
jgi:nucleoside-diphosphate-sugar epimerase